MPAKSNVEDIFRLSGVRRQDRREPDLAECCDAAGEAPCSSDRGQRSGVRQAGRAPFEDEIGEALMQHRCALCDGPAPQGYAAARAQRARISSARARVPGPA